MLRALRARELYEHARALLRRALIAGGEQDQRPRLEAEAGLHRVGDGLHELGYAADDLALFVHAEPVGLAAGLDLGVGAELVYLLAAAGIAGDGDGLDDLALEGAEAAAAEQLRGVLGGEVDAEVGLVGAVFLKRLGIGDALEGRLAGAGILTVLREDGRQDGLEHLEDVLLAGEGHLHVELIELAGGAVRPRVLVAEAGGYLEIAVKARGHEQLLELLRRLGQGVELAGVVPRRDEVVARALGGGHGEDGRGYLHEALRLHGAAERGDDLGAEDYVRLDLRVAQVEVAVAEPRGLVGLA